MTFNSISLKTDYPLPRPALTALGINCYQSINLTLLFHTYSSLTEYILFFMYSSIFDLTTC